MKEKDEEEVELPTFQHVDKAIVYPATSRPLPARVLGAPHVTAFFDGGAAGKVGTVGVVVFGVGGECIKA